MSLLFRSLLLFALGFVGFAVVVVWLVVRVCLCLCVFVFFFFFLCSSSRFCFLDPSVFIFFDLDLLADKMAGTSAEKSAAAKAKLAARFGRVRN